MSSSAVVRGVLERRPPGLVLVTDRPAPVPAAGFTVVVRALMAGAGVSVRGLARTVLYDQGGLSKIIAGKRPCPDYLAAAIDEALGAGGAVAAAAAAEAETRRARKEREPAAPRLTLAEQVAALTAEIRQLRAELAARGRGEGTGDALAAEIRAGLRAELGKPPGRDSRAIGTRSMSEFGRELARLMDARGTGVRELARRVPCNPGHVSNLRSGRDRPSAQLAARLDEILEAGGSLIGVVSGRPAQSPAASRSGPIHS